MFAELYRFDIHSLFINYVHRVISIRNICSTL